MLSKDIAKTWVNKYLLKCFLNRKLGSLNLMVMLELLSEPQKLHFLHMCIENMAKMLVNAHRLLKCAFRGNSIDYQ